MGLVECASSNSVWRGYEYYEEKRVKNLRKIGETQYTADVEGTMKEPYRVLIDVAHPRSSTCNCPHANGRRVVCKHMLAVYFTAFPKEAQRLYEEMIAYQEEEEKQEEELTDKVYQCVFQMSKSDLQYELLGLLLGGPEWQYDQFIRKHKLD